MSSAGIGVSGAPTAVPGYEFHAYYQPAQAVGGDYYDFFPLEDGRLGILYSNKDYGCEWDYDYRNKRFLAQDNTRFGVNIVMYALTGNYKADQVHVPALLERLGN